MNETTTSALVQTFMTHRMDDAAIRMLSTGREQETDRIMDAVERSLKATPGALQHLVLFGPRGIGKSFMARLIQIHCAELAVARKRPIPFVLLPEEQHNLTRNPHALPAYIAHRLADWRTGEDRSWQGAMFQWPDPEQEARQWETATAALETELDQALPGGRGMAVVVIENFDLLLAGVFKDAAAEQRLRKWLDRERNRLMLIATATATVDMDYERPLFQAFQSIRLEPWSQDCCIAYFNRRRDAEGRPALDPEQEAKARAIADFIGGSPRLAQLLAEVLETQDALSVADTMKALTDKLADYYRRRIDDLAPLAQGLLDALIRGGEPASQTELAERVGAPGQSTIARVMQELQRGDLIRGIPARDSRETLYRVTDRVFVHFYRLRQGHQEALKTPLATILDFLRAFYSCDEHRDQAAQHLAAGRPAEARLFADLAREGGPDGALGTGYCSGFSSRLGTIVCICQESLPEPAERILDDLDRCPEELVGRVADWPQQTPMAQAARAIIAAQAFVRLGLEDEAEQRLQQQIEASQEPASSVLLHHELASFLWHVRNDRAAALRHASIVAETDTAGFSPSLKALTLRDRAFALRIEGRHEESVDTAREAARLSEQAQDHHEQAVGLRYAAFSLGQLGRHEEAVDSAREAARLAEQAQDRREQAEDVRYAAFSLGQLGRHEEAVDSARKAARLAEQAQDRCGQAEALRLAAFSFGQLGRHAEAMSAALSGFEIAASVPDGWGIGYTAMESVKAAMQVPSLEAISAFAAWVEYHEQAENEDEIPDWRPWIDEALAAIARAGAWDVLDDLIATHPDLLAELPLGLARLGETLARIGAEEGRALGFEAARNTVRRLVRLWRTSGSHYDRFVLTSLVSAFAQNCRDPGLLRDVAGLLTPDLAPEAPGQARLLRALAELDEAKDPQAVLVRQDPDLALWLRRVRDLPEPSPKVRGRKTRAG